MSVGAYSVVPSHDVDCFDAIRVIGADDEGSGWVFDRSTTRRRGTGIVAATLVAPNCTSVEERHAIARKHFGSPVVGLTPLR